MKLLAVDTTEDTCSAALCVDDEMLWRFEIAPRRHSELILPMVDSLLAEADLIAQQLDALAFSRGPGSFTGVRIATGVAQGIALGADLPVVPVSTLAALAQGAWRTQGARSVLSALDARMGEVYWAYCQLHDGGMVVQGEEQVGKPERLELSAQDDWGVGSGWGAYTDVLQQATGIPMQRIMGEQRIHARDVASLGLVALLAGQTVAPEQALPIYIRDNVAVKSVINPTSI
ncbi:MAG TPA: tRNA (adenosine(37)-N6)-threonylcarbamoyltransferase complex dimerization subunit type 1 TsaB [Thiolapillus brandeum]|uniref:tRNA threonylcarbamoyladenosine biosynthesis protein TsaB n=1 Tax=Thiolapillus brandeum TaxID=1076588 RepID=A0A831K841_9GAMM|nr:tRNA (adenosine(37)-N6)-threonylcarbamoyltransferase complex dimerization subunit type 1 TsaB [Thiolapillus brandeum]